MTVAAPCKHHERIEMPHGPIVKGVCMICGAEREYPAAGTHGYNVTEWLQARNE